MEGQSSQMPAGRAYFRAVLVPLCGLRNLECGLGNFKLWSIFSLSYASYFTEVFHGLYVNFVNRTTPVSMWHQNR